MQHQILGLRDYTTPKGEIKKKDTFYEKNWGTNDLREIFLRNKDLLEKIPTEERFNIYFTVAECVGRREFRRQKFIPFDIDGIDVAKAPQTVEAALKSLGLEWKNTLSLFSGNGVQFFVELKVAFEDPNFFDDQRVFYKACCDRINRALKEADLPGDADSSVFSLARLMRMPGTMNVKPDKPKRMAAILQDVSSPVEFDLQTASGIPKLAREETLAKWPPPDTDAVLAGCENIKAMLSEADKIPEPLWYANASIIGHLGGNPAEGRRIWHDYSSKYSKYDARESDRKLDQAMAASGPRTCANMSQLPGARCEKCPSFKKIKSPIMIIGPNYIATKETGFHSMVSDGEGKPKLGRPNYEDLLKFFESQHSYVVNDESGQIFVFEKTHYVPYSHSRIRAFAQTHFTSCNTQKAAEFLQLILRTNLQSPQWFSDTTKGKMNFQNGMFDIKTMKFTPGHSRDNGFMFTLPYNYDSTEKAPRFERFLEEVTEGDKELQRMLLEYGGYAISNDDYWEHKALLLVGSGRNGKSVFLEVLKNVAEKAYAAVSMRNLQDVQHVALLEGKLFNVSEEGSHNAFKETDIFKTLTAGGEITVKTVYQKPYDIQNRAKLLFSCNELPVSLTDRAFGFYARFAIVPFNAVFTVENRDPYLIKKLRAERAGILNMFLSAYHDMLERGFLKIAASSEKALGEYKFFNDPIEQWIKDHLTVGPVDENVFVKNSDLYASYASYCDLDKVRQVSRVSFFMHLSKHLPNSKDRKIQRKVGGANERVIAGVKLDAKDAF